MNKTIFKNPTKKSFLLLLALLLAASACKKENSFHDSFPKVTENLSSMPEGNDHDDDPVLMEIIESPQGDPRVGLDVHLFSNNYFTSGMTDSAGTVILQSNQTGYSDLWIYDNGQLIFSDIVYLGQDTLVRHDIL